MTSVKRCGLSVFGVARKLLLTCMVSLVVILMGYAARSIVFSEPLINASYFLRGINASDRGSISGRLPVIAHAGGGVDGRTY